MAVRKLLLLMPILGACATARPENALSLLDIDVAAYYDHLRWGHYEEATVFLKSPAGKEVSVVQLERLKHLHISTYELLSQNVSTDKTEARIAVRLDYYSDGDSIAKSDRDEQTWIYDPEAKHWKLSGSFPNFMMNTAY